MSQIAFWGAVELGLVFAFVAIGVYLAFRVLDFPDLTVDGSFPLGAAVTGVLILAGYNPWLAAAIAMVAGAAAGLVTATLNVRFRILNLLASILTMIALFSVNLRVMGRPNIALINQDTMLTPFFGHGIPEYYVRPLFLFVLVAITVFVVWRFLESDMGLAMRATGANPRMARAQGVRTDRQIYLGMAISNALVALGGSLFAQTNGFADVTSGVGTIVVGLAAVIIGETLLRSRYILVILIGCVAGSIIYRIAIQLALSNGDIVGLQSSDLNIATALLVTFALILPRLRRGGASA
ncbi:branched-chain amino acid transport system / permease component family protein [Brucella abortus]|uniref:ABC transporter permease n=1 Tax=Brucella abortus TaxID=235 RepID=UPI0001B5588F|nr:ABC transporter permease [Brucella abortus]AIJ60605.1 branched-chain amino acid transport system / permease component family protein [Brucella abortus bv. 9 str. C68]AIJ79436.1 branched-chain amino acid transport system / permease component family protein [Brucella abortus]AIK04154.1 branched-chain amino acid transport system / permease component family protein [Brucella abortus]EEX81351.1 inner-membrane translocator [Brucella abortus bv. 9 str. C68]EFH33799.1 ABC transport system permease 